MKANRRSSNISHQHTGRDYDRGVAGRGIMEVMVGLLIAVIVGIIFVHIIRVGLSMYSLNTTSSDVADELNRARDIAMKENRKVAVIFDFDKNQYGIDLNGNGQLDGAEAEDLPSGIALSESSVIVFMPSGKLPPKAEDLHVILSNVRNSRSISVSSMGAVSVE